MLPRKQSDSCLMTSWCALVLEHLDRATGSSNTVEVNNATPSPLNGERVGVRGENLKDAPRLPTPNELAHPSPLLPLPVEGRRKPTRSAFVRSVIGGTFVRLGNDERAEGFGCLRFKIPITMTIKNSRDSIALTLCGTFHTLTCSIGSDMKTA